MPASASTCDYGTPPTGGKATKTKTTKNPPPVGTATFEPGTYCGGLSIGNTKNVTLNPGLYIINGGSLQIQGTSSQPINVTANGVTILFTGTDAGMTLAYANLTMSPSTTAGNFSNFLFFLDQSGYQSGCASKGGTGCPLSASQWTSVTMSASGIIYLANQEFDILGCAKGCVATTYNATLNPGAVIAGMLLPDGNVVFTVNGYPKNPGGTPSMLEKNIASGQTAVLVH